MTLTPLDQLDDFQFCFLEVTENGKKKVHVKNSPVEVFFFGGDFLTVEKHGFVCCNMLAVVKHRLLRGDRHFIIFFCLV